MSKKYEVVLFTDMSTKIYPARPLGAYRLATELRKFGISALVVNFFSKWVENPVDFEKLIRGCISDQTYVVAFSSTFFSYDSDWKTTINSWQDYFGGGLNSWPVRDKNKIKLLINRIKKLNPNIKFFYGGAMADRLTDDIKDVGLDYIVQGLGDKSLIESVIRIKNNQTPKFNFKNGFRVIDYDVLGQSFNFPSSTIGYDESDLIKTNEVLSLETSRGCLFHCAFCAFPLLGRNKNHPDYHKNHLNICQEISENYKKWNVNKYMIVDDTFNESTQKLNTIYSAIKQSKVDIEFSAYLRLDLLERFPEQIRLLKDMGLKSAFLGIETLNEKAGKAIGKNSYKVIDTLEKIRDIWQDDVVIHGSLIAGLPYENQETIDQWMTWIFEKKHLLQTYAMTGLIIDQNTSFQSKICKNPEQYGYTFDSQQKWINNIGYSYEDSMITARYWMDKGWDSGRLKLAGWDILGIQNLGYSFDDLKTYSLKDINYSDMQQKYYELVQNYKTDLISYLQSD